MCGDGVADPGEVCDDEDLNDETCLTQDFDGGTLFCNANCDGFDVSECISFSCGNNLIEGNEECDTDDLGGATCVSENFDGGEIACLDDCTFDTSGCFMFSCGNDTIEGAEVCDGIDLGGEDCTSQGHDAGTLACDVGCRSFDVSNCIDFACGNDIREGTEICDGVDLDGEDCITQGFDQGTIACEADCTALDLSGCSDFACGDGTANGTDECDGVDLAGETCVSQGFDGGALACGNACAFNTLPCYEAFTEIEPNDDGIVAVSINDFSAANANGPFSTHTLISAAITLGDDDTFAITNPGPGYAVARLETFGPGGVGTCDIAVDTVIELRTAANVLIVSDDQTGINNCSLLQNIILAPGETEYVRVIDFQDNSTIPAYFLDVQIVPVVCGDAVSGPGEQCDDANAVDGDGCSSTCTLDGAVGEIEPNDTRPQADATGIVIADDTFIAGSIAAVGNVDIFRIDLAGPEILRLETFSALGVCNAITTNLRLFDAGGVPIVADTANLGISGCSAITFPLAAGTYYVQVEEQGNNALIPTYLLEVQHQIDHGTETEVNDLQAMANANIQAVGSEVYVFGDHTLATDSDFYAIDVPVSGSSLRLELIEGDRAVEVCEGTEIDSRITLYNSLGAQLEDDDDTGRGFCSLVDGTGTLPQDPGAHNLAAGTYFVQVRASSFSDDVGNTEGEFIYRLVATIRTP